MLSMPDKKDGICSINVRNAAAWRMFFMQTTGLEPGSSGNKAAALPSVLSPHSLFHSFTPKDKTMPNVKTPKKIATINSIDALMQWFSTFGAVGPGDKFLRQIGPANEVYFD